jgi:ABC-type dipeptide/oligopeptide/nickel transport system permease component
MVSYLVRRLIFAALTVVVITFVVYALIRSMPGDAVSLEMGESDPKRMQSALERERQRKLYGLDHPWPIGYGIWAKNLIVRRDLGKSIFEKKPVYRQIRERFFPTLMLSGFIFPISSMPVFLQWITHIVPARYFLVALRGIVLKGVGPAVFWDDLVALSIFAVAILGLASLRLRRQWA